MLSFWTMKHAKCRVRRHGSYQKRLAPNAGSDPLWSEIAHLAGRTPCGNRSLGEGLFRTGIDAERRTNHQRETSRELTAEPTQCRSNPIPPSLRSRVSFFVERLFVKALNHSPILLHSYFNATIGSTFAARRAGTRMASSATAIAPTTTVP